MGTTLLTQDKKKRNIRMQMDGGAFDLIADVSTDAAGPRKLFLKDVMRVGDFEKESEGLEFSVDEELLRHWAASFQQMKAAGVKVPVTRMHDDTGDPAAGYGWVENMYVQGGRLWAVMDLRGEDAIKAAARSDVSVFSPVEMTDGDGRKWSRPIKHVAMCTDPLITGLGEFKELAAQRSGRKESRMNVEALKKLAELLEVAGEVNADSDEVKILASITAAAEKRGTELTELRASAKKRDADDKDKGDAEDKSDAEKAAIAAAREAVLPEIVEMHSAARGARIDAAVQVGKLSKAAGDKLREAWIGDKGAAIAASQGGDKDKFNAVMEAVEINEPVKVGEKTKAQDLRTSRSDGGGDNPLQADADRRAEEAQAAAKVAAK